MHAKDQRVSTDSRFILMPPFSPCPLCLTLLGVNVSVPVLSPMAALIAWGTSPVSSFVKLPFP